ncbi:hypothetical protein KSP40_PGU008432 [Platanthera guangdongensis]|uniref:High mobility group nucleosome-binding domain-containing protein 3 n=1 Tax=Platanthera guangdongensis TaxID=2320717 RepID=A0ABR2M8C2_9ASPA
MAPKRKSEATVARRSVRSTTAPKTTPTTPQKEASVVNKVKVAGDDKAKPNEDEVELFSPRPRAVPSKKENAGDGKVKPRERKVVGASSAAGKKARSAVDKVKSVGNGATEEPKTVKEGIKHGKIDAAEDEGLQASLSTAPSVLSRTIIVEAWYAWLLLEPFTFFFFYSSVFFFSSKVCAIKMLNHTSRYKWP